MRIIGFIMRIAGYLLLLAAWAFCFTWVGTLFYQQQVELKPIKSKEVIIPDTVFTIKNGNADTTYIYKP